MRSFHIISLISLLLIGCFVAANAQADTMQSLMGWPYSITNAPGLNYSTNNPLGSEPIYNRIAYLVYPVIGLPAIVEPGEELRVIVKFSDPVIYLDPSEWQVRLTTRYENPYDAFAPIGDPVGQNYDLTILDIQYDEQSRTYHLTCETPWGAPEELYHLMVVTDSFIDVQPACVKVKHEIGENFTFVHIADSQVADPRGLPVENQLNNFAYPGFGVKLPSQAIFENEILRELPLLRPDFAVFSGDLIFGLNIVPEIEYFIQVMQQSQIPVFLQPGNHDGYSYFGFTTPEFRQDGLEHFTRILGPQYYSFDYGSFHYMIINSYDGTPLRREAGQLLVASPVDNWGGFLSEEQLTWVARDLAEADRNGKTSLMFMHHDPRGPYTANAPYPTHPFAGDGSEYWNYESSVWDSNPYDNIRNETATSNTGTRLVRLANMYNVPNIFIGHNHGDDIWSFLPGETITDRFGVQVSNLVADDVLSVIQTTTCSAGVRSPADFNGYRMIEVSNGSLRKINYLEEPTLVQSIPAGNFWYESANNDGTFDEALITVINGLPSTIDVTLEFYLAGIEFGYEVRNDITGGTVPIYDLGLGENGEVVLYLKTTAAGVDVSPLDFPVDPGNEKKTIFHAQPKRDNLPPQVSLFVTPIEDDGVWRFDGTESYDPDGGSLRYFWDFGDGYLGTNEIATHKYIAGGPTVVTLTVLDQHGGKATDQTTIELPDCCPDRAHDDEEDLCGQCGIGVGANDWPNLMPMLILLSLLICFRMRRKTRRQA